MSLEDKSDPDSGAVFAFLISTAGPICFLGMQLSSVRTAQEIVMRRSIGSLPLLPFVSLFTNCVIWTLYGILKGDLTVLVPNVVGVGSGAYGTYIYHKYSLTVDKTKIFSFVACILFVVFLLYMSGDASSIGYVGCLLSISVMGSPLSSLKNVIETRSTESMPFSTSLMAFLNSMCWSLYGLLIANEAVIYVPNLIGLAMTSVQMGLFMLYGVHGGYKTVNSLPISGNSIIDDAE